MPSVLSNPLKPSKINIPWLAGLLAMETPQIVLYLRKKLASLGYKVFTDAKSNYVFGIPEKVGTSIALVSHMDTLRKTKATLAIDVEGNIFNKTGILGADDRAGIYSILTLIERLPKDKKPIVIFPNEEEIGGIGVKALIASKALDEFVEDIAFFIEIDRRGHDDFVFYSNKLPEANRQLCIKYGFKEQRGSYSDVKDLTEAYKIPHVNVSAAYYDQHTIRERVNIYELEVIIDRLFNMIVNENPERVLMKEDEVKYVWVNHNHNNHNWSKDYKDTYNLITCAVCDGYFNSWRNDKVCYSCTSAGLKAPKPSNKNGEGIVVKCDICKQFKPSLRFLKYKNTDNLACTDCYDAINKATSTMKGRPNKVMWYDKWRAIYNAERGVEN